MAPEIEIPVAVYWFADVLRTIPAPNDAWAEIIGSIVWPALILFLVLRFRTFIRRFLTILADRLPHDHVKIGMFELRPNDQVVVLDHAKASESTEPYESEDVYRIERIFEFAADANGYARLVEWLRSANLTDIDVVDFVSLPEYALERLRAWNEIEGLKA